MPELLPHSPIGMGAMFFWEDVVRRRIADLMRLIKKGKESNEVDGDSW